MKTKHFPVFLLICLGMAAHAFAAQDFYTADFENWRDNTTHPGFNATLAKSGKKLEIEVSKNHKFGKVMTPEDGIVMNVTPTLILQFTLDRVDPGSAVNVEITASVAPYDSYKVLNGLTKPGTYNVSLGRSTNWSGTKSFWVSIWVEGTGKKVMVSQLRIGENLVKLATPVPTPAPEKKSEKPSEPAAEPQAMKVAAVEEEEPDTSVDFRGDTANAYQYFENWSEGLNGWRDSSKGNSLNTVAEPKKGKLVITLKENFAYGKFVSPTKPLEINFTEYPFLEIELERDLEVGNVKVNLVPQRKPDSYRTVIAQFSRRGVYVANVPDMTGWKGTMPVFVEIWLEGSDTQVSLRSIGFSNNMPVLEGVMIPVQSVSAAELAPSNAATILKISGVADQTFRAQYLEGIATQPDWDELDRYGKPRIDIGYSEIAQKLYFITSIQPMKNISILAALGYDLVNNFEGLTWEDPFARAIKPKIDYGLLRFYDFYAGNVAQIGTVYDPLFTDMTLKKASTFRGFLWKPQVGLFNFKLFGTRMATNTENYKNNIYLIGGRAETNLDLGPGSFRVGLSAINLAKNDGELDSNLFQGHTSEENFRTFMPSVYLRIANRSNGIIYYNNQFAIAGNEWIGVTTETGGVRVDFGPPAGNSYVFDQNKTYYDAASNGQGIYQDGYITLRIPLADMHTGEALDPSKIDEVLGHLQVGAWGRPANTFSGAVELSYSSDNTNFTPFHTESVSTSNGSADFDFALTSSQLADLTGRTFDQMEGTLARSVLGVDVRGQIYDVNVDAEFDASLRHNQTYQGKHTNYQANSYYLRLSRGFAGALAKFSYFQISPDYSTSLDGYDAVDDNDNRALLPDLYPDKAGVVFGDYTNRGIPDKEYTIGIYVPQDYLFSESEDRNHNGILDSRENDHEPDYTYRRDQQGVDLDILIPRQVLEGLLSANFEAQLRAQSITRISTAGRNKTIDFQLNYTNTDVDDLTMKAGFYIANIQDDISDQYALFTAGEKNLVGSGTPNVGEFQISLRNDYIHNLVFTPGVMARYNPSWGLDATVLSRFRLDQPFHFEDHVTHGLDAIVDLRYKHYLVGSLAVMPVYQGRFNSRQANNHQLVESTNITPIHNTYYIPNGFAVGDDVTDIPIFHGLYLKSSYTLLEQYKFQFDLGREISLHSRRGKADEIRDRLAIGMLRGIPRGWIRVQYELTKAAFPLANQENWGQGAIWAQLTVTF